MPDSRPHETAVTAFCIVYSTAGCHLCEQAVALLQQARAERSLDWQEIDIAEDDALVETYGVRIPVLKNPATGAELGWPFNLSQVLAWLPA